VPHDRFERSEEAIVGLVRVSYAGVRQSLWMTRTISLFEVIANRSTGYTIQGFALRKQALLSAH
jgi:hypothetical protein